MAMSRAPRTTLRLLIAVATAATMCMALTGGTALAAGTQHAAHHHHHLRDSDHDGMPNRWEHAHHLRVHHKDAKGDPDEDGLKNLGEFLHHSRPHRADTDSDGLFDGAEVHEFHTDPCSEDSDHDGIEDGSDDGDHDGVVDEGEDHDGEGFVGTIISFDADTGRLTFESELGWPVTALVTDGTHVRFCEECWADGARDYLVEGQDIAEMHFSDELFHGVPVVRWLVLVCPPVD